MLYFSKRVFRLGIIFALAVLLFLYQKSTTTSLSVQKSQPLVHTEKQTQQKTETGTYYSVVRVVDGDTIVIDMEGTDVKVRLIGLDTPEIVDPRRPVRCFGKEASDKAKSILTGQKVKIEIEPTQGVHDKYGRLLAYIFLPDGTLFNQMMIEEGYGHEYTYRIPYKYQKEFKASQVRARELKKGLWADGICE